MVSCIITEAGVHVGATVAVETILGLAAEGIVLSFDVTKKVLVLDTKEVAAKKPLVRLFNAQHLKFIKLVRDAETEELAKTGSRNEQFARNALNEQKALDRVNKAVAELQPALMASADVSPKGQQAYLQLKRTIADTRWSGDDIRVLSLVLVRSPYGVEDVTKDASATGYDEVRASTAIAQVQKILSKPLTEYKTHAPLDFTAEPVLAN